MKKNSMWVMFHFFAASCLLACNGNLGSSDDVTSGGSSVPASEETYEVSAPNTWTISSTQGYSGSIVFSHTSGNLSWVDYDSGGTTLSMMLWTRVWLEYPIAEGKSWSDSGGSNGFIVDATTVIVDTAAQVVVPAGTFPSCVVTSETISVDPNYNNGVYVEEYRRYFAPAVGLVKVTARWKKGTTTVGELLEYNVHNPDLEDLFPMMVNDWWKFNWSTH